MLTVCPYVPIDPEGMHCYRLFLIHITQQRNSIMVFLLDEPSFLYFKVQSGIWLKEIKKFSTAKQMNT